MSLVAMLIRLYIGKCKIADADSMGGPMVLLLAFTGGWAQEAFFLISPLALTTSQCLPLIF